MLRKNGFALLAILPAAVTVTPIPTASAMSVALCTGDGLVRTIVIPTGPKLPPMGNGDSCCTKGCHGSSSRKRSGKQFDRSQ